MTIQIVLLADHPGAIPTLAAWFQVQWPDYFAGRTRAAIGGDFQREAQRGPIPTRLIALVDDELAGTIVLRQQAIPNRPDTHPGLGGLFVPASYRQRGIGSALVRAGMELARAQGDGMVYATTAVAGGILERLGWMVAETAVRHNDERLTLYRCEL